MPRPPSTAALCSARDGGRGHRPRPATKCARHWGGRQHVTFATPAQPFPCRRPCGRVAHGLRRARHRPLRLAPSAGQPAQIAGFLALRAKLGTGLRPAEPRGLFQSTSGDQLGALDRGLVARGVAAGCGAEPGRSFCPTRVARAQRPVAAAVIEEGPATSRRRPRAYVEDCPRPTLRALGGGAGAPPDHRGAARASLFCPARPSTAPSRRLFLVATFGLPTP